MDFGGDLTPFFFFFYFAVGFFLKLILDHKGLVWTGGGPTTFFYSFLPAIFKIFLLSCQRGSPSIAANSLVVKDAAAGFLAVLLNNPLILRPDWAKLCPIRV